MAKMWCGNSGLVVRKGRKCMLILAVVGSVAGFLGCGFFMFSVG